ncbi:hypothetical protein Tco_0599007 [Tanacetum coccineum]
MTQSTFKSSTDKLAWQILDWGDMMRDADLSKDKSGPEPPPEFRRSWCVEGHLADKGLCSRGTKLNSIFTTAESTTKEKASRERSKSKKKRSGHQETSSDSEYEEGSDDAFEDLNSPYKWPKPTPFTQRITHFKYHKRVKLPWNIRVYEGNKDPEDHLGIFSAAAEQKEWSMPIWCKMFHQTLGGAARNLFDDLDPKSVDNFEEVSQKFLEEFSQQKRYAKDPTEIHGIKRRQNEGPERARNRGDPREARRNMGVYTPYPRRDTFTPLTKTLKEILAMESVSFPEPLPLIGTPKMQNLNKFCNYHGDRGHNTNDCYQLKKQIEEAVALENWFFGRNISPPGVIDLLVTMGREGRSKTMLMEFAIVKCHSPYNIIIGRNGMRSLGAVGSTIHSMIKFPTNQGVVTMETSREALRE